MSKNWHAVFFVSKNFYRKLFVKKRVILDRDCTVKKSLVGAFLTAILSGGFVLADTMLFGTVKASTVGLKLTALVGV